MNKPRFVFVIFNMFFTATVGGSELESCAEVIVFVLHVLSLTSEPLVRWRWLAKYQCNLLFQPISNLFTDMALIVTQEILISHSCTAIYQQHVTSLFRDCGWSGRRCRGGSDHKWLSSSLWLAFRCFFFDLEESNPTTE